MARNAGRVRILIAEWTKTLTDSVKDLHSRYKAVADQLDRLPDEDQMDEDEVVQSRASHRELQRIREELTELNTAAKDLQEDLESIVKAANTRLGQLEDASRTLDNLKPVVDDWLR